MREIALPTFVLMPRRLPQGLAELAAAGVRVIEVHGDAPESHIDLTDEAAVNALAQALKTLPLQVHSVHAPFSTPSEAGCDISQPDEEQRHRALARMARVTELSARLGARQVVLHLGVSEPGGEALARARDGLARLGEIAHGVGVGIAVENMPPQFLGGSLEDMEAVLAGLDPEAIGFCLDTGHAMMGSDPPEAYLRALGDRLRAVHWHASNGKDDAHLFPSADPVAWGDFVEALDEIGYQEPVTVEAVPPDSPPLAESIEALRAVLQGARASRST